MSAGPCDGKKSEGREKVKWHLDIMQDGYESGHV